MPALRRAVKKYESSVKALDLSLSDLKIACRIVARMKVIYRCCSTVGKSFFQNTMHHMRASENMAAIY